MRIALISYEYPPDTATGGIAAYTSQAAQMLVQRGHEVVVICGSPRADGVEQSERLKVHRIHAPCRSEFPVLAGKVFAEIHARHRFDVLEGPDYMAEAWPAVRRVPSIPWVVRMHSPSLLIHELNHRHNWQQSMRDSWSSLRRWVGVVRRRRPVPPLVLGSASRTEAWRRDEEEGLACQQADEVVVMNPDLAGYCQERWLIPPERISQIPLPYRADERLISLPVPGRLRHLAFVGRLEGRKGVKELAEALACFLPRHPGLRFSWMGQYEGQTLNGRPVRLWLEDKLQACLGQVDFTGHLSSDQLLERLAGVDVVVLPSRWENFSCACLEAALAGRVILATKTGGFPEILDHGRGGILVEPCSSGSILRGLESVVANESRMKELAEGGRSSVRRLCGWENVGPLMEASCQRAIVRRRGEGVRHL